MCYVSAENDQMIMFQRKTNTFINQKEGDEGGSGCLKSHPTPEVFLIKVKEKLWFSLKVDKHTMCEVRFSTKL